MQFIFFQWDYINLDQLRQWLICPPGALLQKPGSKLYFQTIQTLGIMEVFAKSPPCCNHDRLPGPPQTGTLMFCSADLVSNGISSCLHWIIDSSLMATDEQAWPFCFSDDAKASVMVRMCPQLPCWLRESRAEASLCATCRDMLIWNSQLRLCEVVNLNRELCEIQSHLEDGPMGVPVEDYLPRLSEVESHAQHGQHHSLGQMNPILDHIKRRKLSTELMALKFLTVHVM